VLRDPREVDEPEVDVLVAPLLEESEHIGRGLR
jgi:hypothetical protein